MRVNPSRHFNRAGIRARSKESGQTTIFVVLVLGLFLIAMAGLAIDYSNVYFRRQAAQGAADAACQAGAMDMLVLAQGAPVPAAGFTVGTDFNCTGNMGAVPCQYALLNGHDGTSGLLADTESNEVAVSFPGSVPGVTTPPTEIAGAYPFMRVDVTNRTRMYFSSLLTAQRTKDVTAHAVCGLQEANAPIPIIVLNPTCPHAFEVSGSARLKIIGGPSKSVQVNSANMSTSCATGGSSSGNQCGSGSLSASCPCSSCQVDLCQGGPNFSGSSFGTFGAAGDPSATFAGGSTGSWVSPAAPIPDPFARTAPPTEPAEVTNFTCAGCGYGYVKVAHNVDGCPDVGGCQEYYPGKYTQPIVVQNKTAIFVPGIYYMTAADASANYCGAPSSCSASKPTGQCFASFAVASNGVVRPADCRITGNCNADSQTHDSGGTLFYFTNNSGGAAIVQNAGSRTTGIDQFNTSLATCTGGTPPDNRLGLPTLVDGNVLMGQCTSDGTYTTGAATGDIRGLLFFQDRTITDLHRQSSFQGSGSLLLAGTIYAHNNGSYNDFIQLQGTPGSGTFILGEIVTDQLVLSGNGSIAMQLNPNSVYHILKVSLME